MRAIPQRQSLVSQTVTILRDEIEQGAWGEWLPAERVLCSSLQVSRNTLRLALQQLRRDGLIHSEHGSGTRIVARAGRGSKRLHSRDVGLLLPDPMEHLRPTQALWIDELRAMLSERGCRLHTFHGRQYFRANPAPALRKLVAQNPHGCWILTLSNEPIQQWFERNEIPCVIAGSVHSGRHLPFRDLDHRATCRHAAGIFLGLGHRSIALVMAKSQLAGDLESEAGFLDGVRASPQAGAEALVRYHDGSVAGISNLLRRLLEQKSPPTALLVANAYHYLTVVSRLAQMNLRIPQDISVISRDEDPFLSFLVPRPARYVVSAQSLAKSLLQPVLELLEGRSVTQPALRLMPEFIRGETVAEPPAAGAR